MPPNFKTSRGGNMTTADISMLEHKLRMSEQQDVLDNVGEGVAEGVRQIIGPVAFAGAASFVAYVAGNIAGDALPAGANYLTGLALPDHIIPLVNLSIEIPKGYGLVNAVATVFGKDPNTISSGTLATMPVGAAFAGYVLSRLVGPSLERIGYSRGK